MDEREAIRAAALRRARRECPEAQENARAFRDNRRWHRYWSNNTYDRTTDRSLAIAVATIDGGE